MAISFHTFSLTLPGAEGLEKPKVYGHSLPNHRYNEIQNVDPAVFVGLTALFVSQLPPLYAAFVLERSSDGGVSWSVIATVRDKHFYVDGPISAGAYQYRVKTQDSLGNESIYSDVLEIIAGTDGEQHDLAITEVEWSTGTEVDRLGAGTASPNGFGSVVPLLSPLASGSLAGSFGGGYSYIPGRETSPPITSSHVPACGSGSVAATTSITYSVQDQPYPTGGSGIDDTSWRISLAVSSQYGGSALVIRDGATQPFSGSTPNITCAIANGADPAKDRNITITVPSGYLRQGASVSVLTRVSDLDGNVLEGTCSFTMAVVDEVEPTITHLSPTCGTGTTLGDLPRVERDAEFSFKVEDDNSGVDLTTLQAYYGTSASGPWTQVLQNGSTWLASWSGSITTASGVTTVVARRPLGTLWDADTTYYIRVTVDDVAGNSSESICSWKAEDALHVRAVVPLGENLLIAEFNVGIEPSGAGMSPVGYTLEAVESGLAPVSVHKVWPQRFNQRTINQEDTPNIYGGDPRFVVMRVSVLGQWKEYQLGLTTEVLDKYGQPPKNPSTYTFRARRTKGDDARETSYQEVFADNRSLSSRLMNSIMLVVDEVSGVNTSSDWED